jgi:ribonuclease HI
MGIDPTDAGHPKWNVNILLVGNAAGFAGGFPDPEVSTTIFKKTLIAAINSHAHPSTPLTWHRLQHHWPMDTIQAHANSQEELDTILYRAPAKVIAAPLDCSATSMLAPKPDPCTMLAQAEEALNLNKELQLQFEWKQWVYTDGSQRTVPAGPDDIERVALGSGLYVPSQPTEDEQRIGIQAQTRSRHNTAYRAELIGILGALKQGYGQIMTDSVNSIHSIKAAVCYPAKIRFHRHRNLLEEIRAAVLALEGEVKLVKVRGHAGVPGNEYADDIATTVAISGQATMDLSEVESNFRPTSMWPMQKVWVEDEDSKDGYKDEWQQVEDLDEALGRRVSESGRDLRLGLADATTIYYTAMRKAQADIAKHYADS